MTAPRPLAAVEPVADLDLARMLRTIADRERARHPARQRGARPAPRVDGRETASSLEVAKERLLVWGIRVGGNPGPCFEDIELTVQGRRFLAAVDV